jgi:type VI secretion system protein ImpG
MDVYISLVDTAAAPYSPELSELDVTALCTNRHLPIQMNLDAGPMDLICDSGLPLGSVKCLAKTNPIASPAEGDLAWQTISHLSLNYLSLLDNSASDGAAALRQLLALYTHGLVRQGRDLLEGLLSVRSASVVRRVEAPGALAFARGRIITVKVDDTKFGAADVFLFGAVLEQFFRRYVSLNSFTETVLTTERRGEIMRWPTRPGKRENL